MHFQCHTFKNPVKTKNKHFLLVIIIICTVFPGSSDPFHIVSYYIKWVTTSWTYGIMVFILDGNSEIGAHWWGDLGCLFCWRHLFWSISVTTHKSYFSFRKRLISVPCGIRVNLDIILNLPFFLNFHNGTLVTLLWIAVSEVNELFPRYYIT